MRLLGARRLYLYAFLIATGIIVYREYKVCKDAGKTGFDLLPWPPRIIMTGVAFMGLDAMSFFSAELAGIMAIGFVLAFALTGQWKNTSCNHMADCYSQPGSYQFIEGGIAPPGAQPLPVPALPPGTTPEIPPGSGPPELPPGIEPPALPPGVQAL